MGNGQLKSENATWWDYHELTFWLWAFMRNAEAYLNASAASLDAFHALFSDKPEDAPPDMLTMRAVKTKSDELRNEEHLAAYHFVTTMGVLIRVLKRSQHLFPTIQPPYSRANHLMKEGKEIRDMIEHAYGKDGYLTGGGRHKDRFVRQEAGIAADATSTIIKDGGHWLGNRLCVERAIEEVRAIKVIADTIEPPNNRD